MLKNNLKYTLFLMLCFGCQQEERLQEDKEHCTSIKDQLS
jgi:hypothetical protein